MVSQACERLIIEMTTVVTNTINGAQVGRGEALAIFLAADPIVRADALEELLKARQERDGYVEEQFYR